MQDTQKPLSAEPLVSDGLVADLVAYAHDVWRWIFDHFLQFDRLLELAVIILSFLVGGFLSRWVLRTLAASFKDRKVYQIVEGRTLAPAVTALFTLLFIWTGYFILLPIIEGEYLLQIASNLLAAWIVIHIMAGLVPNRALARAIAVSAWSIAALNLVGLLDPILLVLDEAAIPFGNASLSVLDMVKGAILASLAIWGALALAALLESQLKKIEGLPASAAVLIAKTARIILSVVAFMIALNATGIDLTALAVFGGALGVGIGFGLKNIVSNFIAGLMLLMDRSIKPGDVIEVMDTYGEIKNLAARYTSVITRDGTEYLIPNETMVTEPVINWSHSHRMVRRKITLLVGYDCDLDDAISLMNAAAAEESRVLSNPAPRTLLMDFADDGIKLQLRMWILDPQHGVSNIASQVRMRIWRKFKEHGIAFPYPQRVVRIAHSTDEAESTVEDSFGAAVTAATKATD